MKVSWAPIAKRDRDSQIAYIAERNPSAAIDMGDAIEVTVQLLNDYPFERPSGAGKRLARTGGDRHAVCHRLPRDTGGCGNLAIAPWRPALAESILNPIDDVARPLTTIAI